MEQAWAVASVHMHIPDSALRVYATRDCHQVCNGVKLAAKGTA